MDNNYGGSLIFLAFWLAFCFGLIRGFRKRGAQECIHVFCLAVRPGSVRFTHKREGERERERQQGGKKEDVYKFRKDLHLLVSTPVRCGLTCTHVDASHGAKLRRHLTFTSMVRTSRSIEPPLRHAMQCNPPRAQSQMACGYNGRRPIKGLALIHRLFRLPVRLSNDQLELIFR